MGRTRLVAFFTGALLALGGIGSLTADGERFHRAWPATDFSRTTVELEEVRSGGPPRDGIPALSDAAFVTPAEAADWLHPREPVAVVEVAGEARAYPLQILTWHEIVNDIVGGVPVALTFCPLCNSTLTFDRRVDGRVLEFGVSGLLRRSNLLMYDRQTESWWQQLTGEAVVGTLAGQRLDVVPSWIVAFQDFRERWPAAPVLSRDTGYSRPYGRNPYRGYDRMDSRPFLLEGPPDPRLPAMERVLGIRVGEAVAVYPFSALAGEPLVHDTVGETPVVVLLTSSTLSVLDAGEIAESRSVPAAVAYARRLGGQVLHFELREGRLHDRRTGSRWNLFGEAVAGPLAGQRLPELDAGVHFAFAWLAFRPGSRIYRPEP